MNSTARRTLVTSKDTTSDVAGSGSVHTYIRSYVNNNMFTWDDIVHVHSKILRSSSDGL